MTIGRISATEIAKRLSIGRRTVYQMLEKHIIPAIRLGRRWIITRHAYEQWEQSCGNDDDFSLNKIGGTVQQIQ
jgi:excisionase family DNA binding protein